MHQGAVTVVQSVLQIKYPLTLHPHNVSGITCLSPTNIQFMHVLYINMGLCIKLSINMFDLFNLDYGLYKGWMVLRKK